jgi:hypothetical protein
MLVMARLLVLEPDPDIRELLVRYVRQLGHVPVEPDGGQPPDAVLVEPGDMGSAELAGAFVERHPGLPVVSISIYPKAVLITKLKPKAHLTKPVRLPELRAVLSELL